MITIEITGDSIAEIYGTMKAMLPEPMQGHPLDSLNLEELLLYTDERCQAEGYDMVATKKEQLAPAKTETPKSTLKADLEASIQEIEKKGNGQSKPETDDERKKRCVAKLQVLFAEGDKKRKDQVRALLKEYGDGAKNFHGVPVERFAEISQALEELKP